MTDRSVLIQEITAKCEAAIQMDFGSTVANTTRRERAAWIAACVRRLDSALSAIPDGWRWEWGGYASKAGNGSPMFDVVLRLRHEREIVLGLACQWEPTGWGLGRGSRTPGPIAIAFCEAFDAAH